MCNPMAFLIGGSILQASSQRAQGIAAQGNANLEAADMDYQAALGRDNAQALARSYRREGEAVRGQVLTGAAASGVKIGEGSVLDAEREVMVNAEVDAEMAILRGEQEGRQLNARAEMTRRAGRAAKRAGNIAAFTTLLSAGAQGMRTAKRNVIPSGWDVRGFTGTNDRSLLSTGNNMDWFLRNGSSGD